ncbi:MAG: alcohol dehydrogenase catalytic domain-containing protein [Deltaproteobacteria bacterium]|nr:alcohol dehydrogenase catalytic domain-containing protein [Deltaproteobacteria bacterium]
MKTIFFENQIASWREQPKPEPSRDQALIRVTMAGICQTDIELWAGYYHFAGIPGHEFVGVGAEAPSRPDLIGKRVVAEINCGCGLCPDCLGGDPRHCPDRKAIGIKDWDGCFAGYLLAPLSNIFEVPESVGDEQAVFTEPLAAILQIATQAPLSAHKRLAILGDGKLGLLAALALHNLCPDLTFFGKQPQRLKIAVDFGIKVVNLAQDETPEQLSGRAGIFDIVIEATGRPQGINFALALIKPKGIIVAKTTSHLSSDLALARLVVQEITIVGSRCGKFPPALEFLKRGKLDVRPLIAAIYPFDQFIAAFEFARRRGTGKVLLKY